MVPRQQHVMHEKDCKVGSAVWQQRGTVKWTSPKPKAKVIIASSSPFFHRSHCSAFTAAAPDGEAAVPLLPSEEAVDSFAFGTQEEYYSPFVSSSFFRFVSVSATPWRMTRLHCREGDTHPVRGCEVVPLRGRSGPLVDAGGVAHAAVAIEAMRAFLDERTGEEIEIELMSGKFESPLGCDFEQWMTAIFVCLSVLSGGSARVHNLALDDREEVGSSGEDDGACPGIQLGSVM
ncbi:hypothetical protein BHE74_00032571 [Ensete ventricosum]|nr:hypothetical protein BHE74_00032571 [Ensete ventricosum]RZS09743.1 hypothetical protein BHM03_00040846 [Ensete ventricosum]